jgi:SPP1 gp7 family putative phage head morphogenesis protein
MARAGLKELPDLGADEDLWAAIDEMLRPVIVQEFVRFVRLGFVVAVVELDSILKDFQEDVVARAEALMDEWVARDIDTIGTADPTRRADIDAFVEERFYSKWWEDWSARQRRAVTQEVNLANRDGLSADDVAKKLEPMFGKQRARLIAGTELTNIMGVANQAAYRQLGFQEWEWRTAADRRVDPVCQALDGETFPISVQFSSAHPMCRCWPVPVTGTQKPKEPEVQTQTPGGADVFPPDFPEDRMRKGTPYPEGGFENGKLAEAWFKERYPWVVEVNLSRANMAAMNPSLRNFDLLVGDFPYVAARLKKLGTKAVVGRFSPRTYAHAMFDGRGIGLNGRYYTRTGRDADRVIDMVFSDSTVLRRVGKKGPKVPWHPEGSTDVGSVMIHEFGHLVDGYLSNVGQSGTLNGVRFSEPGIGGSSPSGSWVTDVHNRVRQRTWISEYARKNGAEAYAEAFASWFSSKHGLPGALPPSQLSPAAKAVGEFMEGVAPEMWAPGSAPKSGPAPDSLLQLNDEVLGPLMTEATRRPPADE